ncbi:MAG: dTDP-4-dehydrorhamnose reductase [Cetobacterium sp.]
MILITGGDGQLAREFSRFFESRGEKFLAPKRCELDIANFSKVAKFVKKNSVKTIINCAAYNFVDRAEVEKEMAYSINAYSVQNLARIARELDIEFVTYSTDFVFDGKKNGEYVESDEVNPISVYGKSKALGEKLALEANVKTYIFRVSWVFGEGGSNFIEQVKSWSFKERVSLASDGVSSPTSTLDIVNLTLRVLKIKKYGIYHISGGGEASRYEQGRYILEKLGYNGEIHEGRTLDFTPYDIRPKYSKLSSSKIEELLDIKIPGWKERIDQYLY